MDMNRNDQVYLIGQDEKEREARKKSCTTYMLEHLATFTVSRENALFTPTDGMKRLLQLEKSTGIWSQKMKLSIDEYWVLIIDYESGNIIERFPTNLIKDPTAFTSNDSMELYNNILIFIVTNESNNRSEMHIFQSLSISAVELVEVFKNVEKSKFIDTSFKKQLHNNDIEASNNGFKDFFLSNTTPILKDATGSAPLEGGSCYNGDSDNLEDSNISGACDLYERDVSVLNHCFDDIEKFISRLQHAAAASRELERRRQSRRTKIKDLGEGLLSIRTRPPLEKEFIDIFSKFKLSFNLLAKLKSHIHDPNAPELVHFLFTPLALIVEAASDSYYDLQLPSQVVTPLLTRDAINLLINCVTSKETELWRSLGDAWVIPRDQWKVENIDLYHPVFMDGWSPDFVIFDEANSSVLGMKKKLSKNKLLRSTLSDGENIEAFRGLGKAHNNIHDSILKKYNDTSNNVEKLTDDVDCLEIQDNAGNNVESDQTINPHTTTHDKQNDDFFSPDCTTWLAELQNARAKIVQVTYPRTANNDKELTVVRGEFLEVLDDSRKWWKAKNIHGEIAHVPHTIVAPYHSSNNADINSSRGINKTGNSIYSDNQNGSPICEKANSIKNNNSYIGRKGEFRYF